MKSLPPYVLAAALVALAILFPTRRAKADDAKPDDAKATIKIACVGDSITHGSGTKNAKVDAYPAQLGRLLGSDYQVGNFGVSGATLLKHGDKPYQNQKLFKAALAFNPNIVIIMLGTNDTKPQNWKLKDDFVSDYKDLIDQFAALPAKPKIYLCRPVPVVGDGSYHIVETGVQEEIPLIDGIAKDENATIIDMHAAFDGKDDLIPDKVHPNTAGAAVMAKTVFKALTGKDFEGEVPAGK